MSKLIIYQPKDFQNLKNQLELSGKSIIRIYEIYNIQNNKVNDDHFDSNEILINISSLQTIENTISLELFEKLFFYLSDFDFISDCDDINFKYRMDYFFEIVEEYSSDTTDKKKEHLNDNQKKLIPDLSIAEIEELIIDFNQGLIGHQKFKDQLSEKMIEFKLFHSIDENPIFSFFILGESGVGKTEVARIFHNLLGGEHPLAKINFGNYSSHDSLNSLIGSPRGYIGSETGELFEKISKSDTGIILIDEFEKATPELFNYFLETLESGIATASNGTSINLSGYIFIFTSNVPIDKYESTFSPELRSRFNYVCSFNPLSNDDKKNYLYTRFSKYVDKLNSKHNRELSKPSIDDLVKKINVAQYSNIRILNSKIRQIFMEYVKENFPNTDTLWE